MEILKAVYNGVCVAINNADTGYQYLFGVSERYDGAEWNVKAWGAFYEQFFPNLLNISLIWILLRLVLK